MRPIKLTFVLAAARQFEGTVLSVNRDANTFRLSDVERGTKRFKVTAKRKSWTWIAIEVERSGDGGEHGGGGDDR